MFTAIFGQQGRQFAQSRGCHRTRSAFTLLYSVRQCVREQQYRSTDGVMKSDPMQRKLPSSFEKWNQFVSPEPHLTDCARTALPVENLPCICALRAAVRCSGAAMNGLRALSRYSRRLPPSNPQARALQTLLQTCLTWQQPTASRAYSAEADDDGKGTVTRFSLGCSMTAKSSLALTSYALRQVHLHLRTLEAAGEVGLSSNYQVSI